MLRGIVFTFLTLLTLTFACQAEQKVDVWTSNGLATGSKNPYTGSFTIMDGEGMVLGQRDAQGNWSIVDLGDGTIDRNSVIIDKFMQEDSGHEGGGWKSDD